MEQPSHYRPDIDGLRAIAVTSVVGYHAFPQLFQGGFVGVDIFFVISGFLITSIILDLSAQKRFSVIDFYQRRIRRIFPALIAMFVTCLLFGWLLLFPDELQQLGKHTLAASFFIANFAFWSEAGYFDTASELKPLLHLWSLSIEEQFYALWPLTLLLLLKYRRPVILVAVLILASLLLCLYDGIDRTTSFYMPHTRVWELLAGGMLAFFRNSNLKKRPVDELLSIAGICLLVLSVFFLIDSRTAFPGWLSLLPILGTACLIAAGTQAMLNKYLLGNRVFVFIGLISYPLYLWHWPFLAFPKIIEGAELSLITRISAVTAAVVFAVLTYFFIEKPLRHRGTMVSVILFISMMLTGFTGYLVWHGKIQPRHSGELAQKIADAKIDIPFHPDYSKSYHVIIDNITYNAAGNGTKTTLYIGDSNMYQFFPGVEAVLVDRGAERKALLGGCQIPIPDVGYPGNDTCMDANKHAYKLALNDKNIDTVVIAAMWRSAGSFEYLYQGKYYPMTTQQGMDLAMDRLAKTIKELTAKGKTVYLILNIPGGPEFEPHNLVKRSLHTLNMAPHLEGGLSLQAHREMTYRISTYLRNAAEQGGGIILDPADFLCDRTWCSAVSAEGDPIYRDMDHLRGTFAYKHKDFIGQTLR